MGEKLASPPLIEAICEFKFEPSASWDWTIPGRLYEQMAPDFPEKSQIEGMQLELKMQAGREPAPQVIRGPALVQMKRRDGSAMVQVGPGMVAINHLRPYVEWRDFRTLILDVFDRHAAIIGDYSLLRIGLRYINKIELAGASTELNTVISLVPTFAGVLKRPLAGFYQRYELLHETPRGALILQTGVQGGGTPAAMMVDLDFGSLDIDKRPDRGSIEAWLDKAHDRVYESFVATLNPDLYQRFKKGIT